DLMRLVETEGEEDRLLQPLMHDPAAVALLGHAKLALVEQIEHLADRIADHALGFRRDLNGMLVGAVDEGLEMVVGHGGLGQIRQNCAWPGASAASPAVSAAPISARKAGSFSVR